MSVTVPWLSVFPDAWSSVPSKRLFSESKTRAQTEDEQLTASQDYGVIPQKEFIRRAGRSVVQLNQHLDKRKRVERDDFVISMRSFQGGLERAWVSGGIRSSYVVLKPSPVVHVGYFSRLFKSQEYVQALQATAHFIRDGQDLNFQNFMLVELPLPPFNDQVKIAKFLDYETAKIDALIEKQQQLIALLKEKRQAVISHAVTKGLNPDVPMRNSGVEWLGEVPAHWSVCGFSHAVYYQEGPGIMATDFHDDGVPLVRISGVKSRWVTLEGCNFLDPNLVKRRWGHFRLQKGDLLISASASMGTVAEVNDEAAGAIPYTGLIKLVPRDGQSVRGFVRSLVVSDVFINQIDLLKAGATIQHFGPTHLRQLRIARPPLDEQEDIAQHIDNQVRRFRALAAKAEGVIELLQERRTALISAAVTGKIDVRDWKPPQSETEAAVA